MTAAFIFLVLIALLLVGMPVSIALGLTVLTVLFVLTDVPLDAVALKLFTGIESFELMCVPFFILAGNFLTHGGVARRMIRFATAMTGHWPGGLGLAAVVACAIFAAVSGSSPATVVAIGSIMIPAMVARGYPKSFGAGVVASSGALGILIPPSIVMVLYAVATSGMAVKGPGGERVYAASVDDLFMAGVVPGIMLATILALTTVWLAWRRGYPRSERESWSERFSALADCFWGLALIVIVMGGIYGGVFTPTEAAVVAAVYALFVATIVYRELKLNQLYEVFVSAAKTTAVIMFLVAAAMVSAWLITVAQIPAELVSMLQPFMDNQTLLLIAIMLLVIAVGTAMDMTPTILIMTPVLMPVVRAAGIDPVYFGVLFIMNNAIGLITPPVGTVLNVVAGVGRMKMDEVTRGVVPFMLAQFAVMFLLVLFPSLVLVPLRFFTS